MFDTRILLIIALILLTTKAFSIAMKKIHMPQVIGALIAGVLLGPAVFKLVEPNDTIGVIAEFGVIFLLFAAGLETDFRQLKGMLKPSLLISVLGVVVALGGGFGLALLFSKTLGLSVFQSFYIGVVIASMSTSITVEALSEMGKLKTKTGTALLGASVFDDILVIMVLAVTMGIGSNGFSLVTLGIIIVKIIVFFAFATGAGFLVNKLFNWAYARMGEKRRFTVFAIAYCFLMAYLAELFGLADITGAYIAGVAFCSTRCVEFLESKTHWLSYMLFTPVFLANIGIHTSFSGMTSSLILFTLLLVLVAILSKLMGCGLGAKFSKFTNRESLQVGAGMVARGEVSIIVASKGIALGYLGSIMYPSIIVVVLVTVLIAPLMLKAAYPKEPIQPVSGQ
ncbi:MAG: cation:proton antiporter [Treponema sp.]|jgi:Kef-type K+ transport system membrane component KefB|nr:cation:proton antiporter [Treponema sp.]